MSKKRSRNQKLEELSKSKLRALLCDWIVNELNNDFGFDFEVRICSSMDCDLQEVSEYSFYIQLKSSSEDDFHDLEVTDWELFSSQHLPVVLMKYSEKTNIFYWEIIQTYIWDYLEKSDPQWRTKKSKRIKFKNILEDLEVFKNHIIDSQNRIVTHSFRSLDFDENPVKECFSSKTKIYHVPNIPKYFIERPEVTQEIKDYLLNKNIAEGGLVVSAIHGLGGIGKSTIAAYLAHDREIQESFSDGIFWATLGQQPSLLTLLSSWIRGLGDSEFHPTTIEDASDYLRNKLFDKSVLLVVDDAWESAHVQYFMVGGPHCQVLITTRDSLIARSVNATPIYLDIMSEPQAISLLSSRLRKDLKGEEENQAKNLAQIVGYLPLALELAAVQIEEGIPWSKLLEELKDEYKRLLALEIPGVEEIDEKSRRNLSLKASFYQSLKKLSKENLTAFIWLGVLPDDVEINAEMASTLWFRRDWKEAFDILRYLRYKALLLPGTSKFLGRPTFRQHDFLHFIAYNLIEATPKPETEGDLPGLGLKISESHTILLNNYKSKTQSGLWHTLPDDGYIYNKLVWHMEKADLIDEIHNLLREEKDDGKNGWYEKRESLGQTSGYLEDIASAWRFSENLSTKSLNEENVLSTLGLEIRFALITASISTLSARISPYLLEALVNRNIWNPFQGFSYARMDPKPNMKILKIQKVFDSLPSIAMKKKAMDSAIDASKLISTVECREKVLTEPLIKFSEALPEEVLSVVNDFETEEVKSSIISQIFPMLSKSDKIKAINTIEQIGNNVLREKTLYCIIPKYPTDMIDKAFKTIIQMENEYWKKNTLKIIIPLLSGSLKDEALELLQTRENHYWEKETVSQLITKDEQLILELMSKIKERKDETLTVRKLIETVPELSESEITKVFGIAKNILDEDNRVKLLLAIIPRLPESILEDAIKVSMQIHDEYSQSKMLKELVIRISNFNPEASLDLLKVIKGEDWLSKAIVQLISILPEAMILDLFYVSRNIHNDFWKENILNKIFPKLPTYLLNEEREKELHDIQDVLSKEFCLSRIIPKLPPVLLDEKLKSIYEFEDFSLGMKTLEETIIMLPESMSLDALRITKNIPNESSRFNILIKIIPRLPDKEKEEALDQVIKIARETQEEIFKIKRLSEIIPTTQGTQQEELRKETIELMWKVYKEIRDSIIQQKKAVTSNQVDSIILNDPNVQKGVEIISPRAKIEYENRQKETLVDLFNIILLTMPDEALDMLRKIEDSTQRFDIVINILKRLDSLKEFQVNTPGMLEEASEMIKNIEDPDQGVNFVKRIQNRLTSKEIFPEVTANMAEETRKILNLKDKSTAYEMLSNSLHSFVGSNFREFLFIQIGYLSSCIYIIGGEKALAETYYSIQDVSRWWP